MYQPLYPHSPSPLYSPLSPHSPQFALPFTGCSHWLLMLVVLFVMSAVTLFVETDGFPTVCLDDDLLWWEQQWPLTSQEIWLTTYEQVLPSPLILSWLMIGWLQSILVNDWLIVFLSWLMIWWTFSLGCIGEPSRWTNGWRLVCNYHCVTSYDNRAIFGSALMQKIVYPQRCIVGMFVISSFICSQFNFALLLHDCVDAPTCFSL